MVVGYIDYFINERHAKIKVLAIEEPGSLNMDEQDIREEFSPSGYVFEDSFTSKYEQYIEGDVIRFVPLENSYSFDDDSKDKFKIDFIKTKLEYQVITLDNIMTASGTVDMNFLQSIAKNLPDKFFLQNTSGYYGPFKKINNLVKPSTGTTVGFREFLDNIAEYNNKKIVIGNPKKTSSYIDASNDDQLQKWFKEILRSANTPFFKALLENKDWKSELFDLPIGDLSVDKAKLKKVISQLDSFDITLNELKVLCDNSEKLKGYFENKVDIFKREIIKEKKIEMQEELGALTNIIDALKKQKTKGEKELEVLIAKKIKVEADTSHFLKNKDRLLADFKVLQSLLPNTNNSISTEKKIESFLIEESETDFESSELSIKEFDNNIIHYLANYSKGIEEVKFRFIREMIATYNCVFADSLELVLAFIKATNNYRYIISQVEAKWLSFKDCWENGLSEIWSLAYEKPDVIHFLILRDCNLSSPECYAAPLLDVDRGIRERLPYDGRGWPKNLRIIATTQPTPEVGLPVLESTFNNWGAIRKIDLVVEPDEAPELYKGYLGIKEFEKWKKYKLDITNNISEYLS